MNRKTRGIAATHEIRMPEDWNNRAGWDTYYQSRLARNDWDNETGSISIEQLPNLSEDLKSRGWRCIWIPGCGISPLGQLLAHLGLQVVVTDVSPVAVDFQRSKTGQFPRLTAKLGTADSTGSFSAEVHDFHQEFQREAFDLIINVKAFQAFSAPDMRQIALNHAAALRKGRYAYFDTMNVQGESRDQLEQALEDGGFIVPFMALNRWYGRTLSETGIPYLFVLGQPMIPRTGEYADGGSKWKEDMARLQEISKEYNSRLEIEQETEQSRVGSDTKVAQVIYSTG